MSKVFYPCFLNSQVGAKAGSQAKYEQVADPSTRSSLRIFDKWRVALARVLPHEELEPVQLPDVSPQVGHALACISSCASTVGLLITCRYTGTCARRWAGFTSNEGAHGQKPNPDELEKVKTA